MYIYYALINALGAHMIHINLNMVFYTHVEHSPTKTIYISILYGYQSVDENLQLRISTQTGALCCGCQLKQ